MFRKKPTFKPLAPLRSSDKRKVTDQIIQQCKLQTPQRQSDDGENLDQAGLTAFRNAILPEGTLSAAFTTTIGPNLKTYRGTIYAGSYIDDQARILWIRLEDGTFVPTVYTLWRHPGIVALLHTPDAVIQKMREGADLNTPGLTHGPPFPVKATKGSIVAIASHEEPSIPLIVGICEIDVSALTEVRGQRGHAIRPLHCEGDELWNWSQLGQSGLAAPNRLDGWLQADVNVNSVEIRPDVTKRTEDTMIDTAGRKDALDDAGLMNDSGNKQDQPQLKVWQTQDVDSAFRDAFIYSLYEMRNDKIQLDGGVDFPVSQSQFMSVLITPYLPVFTPQDAAALQIKKTSYKNVKKFVKALDKDMLLKSKDRNGGEVVVLDVDLDDQRVLSFTPYRLPKRRVGKAGKDGHELTGVTDTEDTAVGQQLKRLMLLRPREKLISILGDDSVRCLFQAHELKQLVVKYVEDEALVNSNDKRLASINPALANTLFDSGGSFDNEILNKGMMPRNNLIEHVVASCLPYWIVLRNEEARDDTKAKAGKPPTVKIVLETRSGNRIASRVFGFEPFYINAPSLAMELQKSCASSTTLTQVHGSSPKNPAMEVMVQGPQKDAILKALGRRGVKKDWVEITDKTKTKKK